VIVNSYNAEPIHACTDPGDAGHQRFQRNPLRADEGDPDSEGDLLVGAAAAHPTPASRRAATRQRAKLASG
jgi:hypothetical protein